MASVEPARAGQEELFHDSLGDALRAVVYAIGGPKKVGAELWPDKSQKDAADLLLHCLDDSRPEKLELGQVMWLLNRARVEGVHTAMRWLGEKLAYEVEAIEPETEQAKLQRLYVNAVAQLADLTRRITDNTSAIAAKAKGPRRAS